MKVRNVIRVGAVVATSAALAGVGGGMGLTAANLGHAGGLTAPQPTGQGATSSAGMTLSTATGRISAQSQGV